MMPVLSSMQLSHSVKSKLSKKIHDLVTNSAEIDRDLLEAVCHVLLGVDAATLLPGGIPSDKSVELWGNDVQYLEIARTTQFSVAVFLIKKGGTIPLHDHPRMNVVSRLLFGELREVSYDWEDAGGPLKANKKTSTGTTTKTKTNNNNNTNNTTTDTNTDTNTNTNTDTNTVVLSGSAVVSKNELRTVDDKHCALIEPYGGNLHEVVAESTCAFLDCFLPPYDVGNRDCTYYRGVKEGTTNGLAKKAKATTTTENDNRITANDDTTTANDNKTTANDDTPAKLQPGTHINLESYDPQFFTEDYLTTVTGLHRILTPSALQPPRPEPNTLLTPTPRPVSH